MKYYIDGAEKKAILKIWNSKGEMFLFRLEEKKDGTIKIF